MEEAALGPPFAAEGAGSRAGDPETADGAQSLGVPSPSFPRPRGMAPRPAARPAGASTAAPVAAAAAAAGRPPGGGSGAANNGRARPRTCERKKGGRAGAGARRGSAGAGGARAGQAGERERLRRRGRAARAREGAAGAQGRRAEAGGGGGGRGARGVEAGSGGGGGRAGSVLCSVCQCWSRLQSVPGEKVNTLVGGVRKAPTSAPLVGETEGAGEPCGSAARGEPGEERPLRGLPSPAPSLPPRALSGREGEGRRMAGAGEPGRRRMNWGGGRVWRGWDDTGVQRGGAGRKARMPAQTEGGGVEGWGGGRQGPGRWGRWGRGGNGRKRGPRVEQRCRRGRGRVPVGGEGRTGEGRGQRRGDGGRPIPGGSAGHGPGGAGGTAERGRAGGWWWWLFLYNGQVINT